MFYIFLILWIFFDLFTKKLAFLYLDEKVSVFWDLLYLQYVENTGIAFSIQINSFFLKILTIFLIILIYYYYRNQRQIIISNDLNKKRQLFDTSFWLILAWAVWNGVERVFNSKVIDFIGVKYFSVFNLADTFITVWAIVYLYILFKSKK